MEIDREDERPNVTMNPSDKDAINKFAGFLSRRNDLRARLARRKKLVQLHEDASDELVLLDDEVPVFYNIGDVFIMDDKAQIETNVEKTKDELTSDAADYQREIDQIEKEMAKLKAKLYAKFGKVSFTALVHPFHSSPIYILFFR